MPFADLSDVRCYYELCGAGEPLLLIPGLGTTCRLWDDAVPELSRSFSLILVDNRGVGRSAARRPARCLDELSVDLVELLDMLQVEQAHVIGLSLGGLIAQRLALDHPGRVNRLILISCTHAFGSYLREMARLLAQAARYFPKEVYRRTIEVLGTSPEYLDSHPNHMSDKLLACNDSPISRAAVARQLQCIGSSDLSDGRSHISSPTLVIAGDSDAIIPARYARLMADTIPDCEFALVPGCGHNPVFEKPEIVIPRMVEFLERARNPQEAAHPPREAASV
jgi:3-oxoadipate enol-lactonase